MTMTSTHPIILHHFEESPFSEKIRVVFGVKKLEWTSVLISRIMPRPDLMPLTGGYRRTPVMQIGADIYCDTQCIIRELERRFGEPTLFPRGYEGLGSATAMWSDRSFFQNTVNLVFGALADRVPPDFIADREKLRGAKFDVGGDDSGDSPDARSVPRPFAMDRKPACGGTEVDERGQCRRLRYQRLHEYLVRPRPSSECRGDARRIRRRQCMGKADAGDRPRPPQRDVELRSARSRGRRDATDRRIGRSQRPQWPQAGRQGRRRAGRLRQG
jgi:hypothetical protein